MCENLILWIVIVILVVIIILLLIFYKPSCKTKEAPSKVSLSTSSMNLGSRSYIETNNTPLDLSPTWDANCDAQKYPKCPNFSGLLTKLKVMFDEKLLQDTLSEVLSENIDDIDIIDTPSLTNDPYDEKWIITDMRKVSQSDTNGVQKPTKNIGVPCPPTTVYTKTKDSSEISQDGYITINIIGHFYKEPGYKNCSSDTTYVEIILNNVYDKDKKVHNNEAYLFYLEGKHLNGHNNDGGNSIKIVTFW